MKRDVFTCGGCGKQVFRAFLSEVRGGLLFDASPVERIVGGDDLEPGQIAHVVTERFKQHVCNLIYIREPHKAYGWR